MTLAEARRIVAEQDHSDPYRSIKAVAVMLRFYGIADPALLPIAEMLESVDAPPAQDGEPGHG